MIIVLCGPDGCGKTTIANSLANYLNTQTFHSPFTVKAYRFQILPPLRKLFFLKAKSFEVNQKHSGMCRPVHPLKLTPSFLYNCIDYFIGFLLLPGRNIIFARYYHDNYVQRSYLRFPRIILDFFNYFIPKPDFIFFLNRNPNLIYKYKPELTIKEIRRQSSEYKKSYLIFLTFILFNQIHL